MLYQQLSLSDCELRFASTDGRFSGYGSVFGVVDSKKSIIMPGAYAEVLKQGGPVDVYVNHGWLRDELPVGRWSNLQEDSRGLRGDAELVMGMPAALNAYWAVKSSLVNGLSVAIIPDKNAVERKDDGTRVIHRIAALKEISIVSEPANAEARVTDVRFLNEVEAIESVREFESFLRDVGGFSKSAAKTLAARAHEVFGRRDADPGGDSAMELSDVAAKLMQLRSKIALTL